MSAELETSLPFVLIRIERVMAATDFGRTKIAELLDPDSPRYDPTFPKPRRAGARALRWRSDELAAWMAGLPLADGAEVPNLPEPTRQQTVVQIRGTSAV